MKSVFYSLIVSSKRYYFSRRARVVRNNDGALTACALVLHPDILSVLATGLPQVTMVRVGHVVGAADGIGSQRTIRRALTQTFAVFGNDARRAPGAVDLLAGF